MENSNETEDKACLEKMIWEEMMRSCEEYKKNNPPAENQNVLKKKMVKNYKEEETEKKDEKRTVESSEEEEYMKKREEKRKRRVGVSSKSDDDTYTPSVDSSESLGEYESLSKSDGTDDYGDDDSEAIGLRREVSTMTRLGFYKLMKDEDLSLDAFELPKKFVSLHGASMPSLVRLKTHSGLEWKVKVVKHQGRIWLDDGWPDFEEHYRLEFGYILCFRYIPNSSFEVSIFDLSTCEIHHFGQAPSKRARTTDATGKMSRSAEQRKYFRTENSFSRDSGENLKSGGHFKNNVRKYPRMENSFSYDNGENFKSGGHSKKNIHKYPRMENSFGHDGENLKSGGHSKKNVHKYSKMENSFSDDDEKNIKYGGHSKKIVRKYPKMENSFSHDNGENLEFGGHSKKNVRRYPKMENSLSHDNGENLKSRGHYKKNVRKHPRAENLFSHDNGENLKSRGYLKNNVPKAGTKRKQRMKVTGTKACEDSASFKSPYPYFRSVIRNNSRYYSNVPFRFGDKHFKRGYRTVRLVKNGKSWLVTLCFGLASGYQFSAGFMGFVRENNLVPGDFCAYELVERSNIVLRVTCFRNPR